MPPTDENQNPNVTFSLHPVNWSVPPQQARTHLANPPENVAAISKKQKSGGADSDETDLRIAELTEKYRTLGAHLWCERKAITSMSKTNIKAHGRATLEHPPENIVFQDCFMHKRQRRSNKSMTAQPSMSAVNVYVNTGPGQSSQSHQVGTTSQNSVTITSPPKSGRGTLTDSSRQNLPDEAGTKTTPIEIVESPSPSSGYPLVADIFCHMDNLSDFRNLEIPPSTFATYLEHEWELTTVKQAAIIH
ncbi:hypothetical protein C8J56DRAFT_1049681 [Mycena floridula]|nr:hypothetical protein C8J56DRAFT_1049681 [Mycena floridula]